MVKLRLKRMGRKRRPFYRIVAMTDNQPRSGQALEELGTYDPVHSRFDVNEEAAITWLNNGAQMTETVHDLFNSKGLLARWRGFEGVQRDDALKTDKPKRRKKLAGASAAAASAETVDDAPAVEDAPAPEAEAEAVEAAEAPAEAEASDAADGDESTDK